MSELGLWRIAASDPERLAVVDVNERLTTFGELASASNRLSHAFRSLGLCSGDTVAMIMPNGREFLEVFFGAQQIGLYLVCVNYHLTASESAYIVRDSQAKLLIVHEGFSAAATVAATELQLASTACWAFGKVDGFGDLPALAREQEHAPPEGRGAGQVMLYTSGTTGQPKGVRMPLRDIDPDDVGTQWERQASMLGIPPSPGAHLVAGPMYHAAPLLYGTGALHLGKAVVLMDHWTPRRMLELITRYRVTDSHMVPTMFHRLLQLPEDDRAEYDVSSLRSIVHGAAPCPMEVKRKIIEWWGPIVSEYYAATEGGGTYVLAEDWLKHPGTVGRPFPGATIVILDEDGHECAPGEPGAIYMGNMMSFEYFNDRKKTENAQRGNLFTVGDIGYLDEGGWLFLRDRKSDLIIAGGVNIYPAEVEAVLLQHPEVADVAVIGVPDNDMGEAVKAIVQPADGTAPSPALEAELLGFCSQHLARFKCPRSVDFSDELPRSSTGKLAKRLLRDAYWQGVDRRI